MTNETIQTLLERRSVRSYKPEQITEEERDTILNVGVWAPTGCNVQPLRFVVIQDPAIRSRLFEVAGTFPNRGGNPFYDAPTIVVVFVDQETAVTPVPDGSIAAINMQNAAASIGVASCWINCVKELFATEEGKALKRDLLADDHFVPICAVILGYASEVPQPQPRAEGHILLY